MTFGELNMQKTDITEVVDVTAPTAKAGGLPRILYRQIAIPI